MSEVARGRRVCKHLKHHNCSQLNRNDAWRQKPMFLWVTRPGFRVTVMIARTSFPVGGSLTGSKSVSVSTDAFVITESSSSKQKKGLSSSSGFSYGPTWPLSRGTESASNRVLDGYRGLHC